MPVILAVTEAEVAGWAVTATAIITAFFVLVNLVEKKIMALAVQFAKDKASLEAATQVVNAKVDTAKADAKDSKGIALSAATKADIANTTAAIANALAAANKDAINNTVLQTSDAVNGLRDTSNTHDHALTLLALSQAPPESIPVPLLPTPRPTPAQLGLKRIDLTQGS